MFLYFGYTFTRLPGSAAEEATKPGFVLEGCLVPNKVHV